jgi:hypothetical protein
MGDPRSLATDRVAQACEGLDQQSLYQVNENRPLRAQNVR